MAESLSRVITSEEHPSSSFPMNIDLSSLKSYFDLLEMQLKVPIHLLHDKELTARVQLLIDKQETVSHKCHLLLKKFFNASIVGNPNVAVNNWQEVAALNVVVAWFLSEGKRIHKNLSKLITLLICMEMITDVDIGRLSISEDQVTADSRIVQDPTVKDKVVSVQEPSHRAENSDRTEEMKAMAEGREDADALGQGLIDSVRAQELKSEIHQVVDTIFHEALLEGEKGKRKERKKKNHAWNEDDEKLERILRKASKLEKQIAPTFTDLFFLLKMYDLETTKISQVKATLEEARTWEDEPRFIEKIMNLLELADRELYKVRQWCMIEGVNDDLEDHTPEKISGEITKVNKLLDELTRLMLNLGSFTSFRGLSDLWTEDVVTLEKIFEDTEAELIDMKAKVDELKVKVKQGLFIEVVGVLCHAGDSIDQISTELICL